MISAEDLPVFALQDDRVVEVVGDPAGVHKAVELIASHLRKFLVDRSIIPIFEMHKKMVFTFHHHSNKVIIFLLVFWEMELLTYCVFTYPSKK